MKCSRCKGREATALINITVNVHEALCRECDAEWTEHARKRMVPRNTLGAILREYRRWQREVRT